MEEGLLNQVWRPKTCLGLDGRETAMGALYRVHTQPGLHLIGCVLDQLCWVGTNAASCGQGQESSLSKVEQFSDKTAATRMGAKKGMEARAWCVA